MVDVRLGGGRPSERDAQGPFAQSRIHAHGVSTCERLTLPEEQAEPDDTATPARSSLISSVSALRPGVAKAEVLGSRGALACRRSRLRREREHARLQPVAQKRSRGSPRQRRARVRPPRRSRRCPGRFSVPARQPRSCPPPRKGLSASSSAPVRKTIAPTPFGPPILWADSVRASTPRALISIAILPAPGRRRNARARHVCRASRRSPRAAGRRRSRCWRDGPRPALGRH
jgi:hypothetical protein